ncbi:MAG: carboxy-S-adenosyl-L-methionine synthase CmoA [Gammaproteobacteria bacterium]
MPKTDDSKSGADVTPLHDSRREPGPDELYRDERSPHDFNFGADTVKVFDDMVQRSVPFYAEIQRMTGELAADFAVPGSRLYDIGCSTGTTLLSLHPLIDNSVEFVGIDNSDDMLAKARVKQEQVRADRKVELLNMDLNRGIVMENASVVVMLLTMQFVRPLYREDILRRIYQSLHENSCLLMVEKVTGPYSTLNRLFIEHYYDFKRRSGYTNLEISQKRDALENILIPYHVQENRELLHKVGFTQFEEFFRWYNFCGMIAVK